MAFYIKRLFALFFLAALSALAYFIFWSVDVSRIDIISTAEGYGHVLPSRDLNREGNPKIGGASALASFLRDFKRPYILLDAGNFYYGTAEGVLTRGEAVVKVMNFLEYDALAAGPDDFGHGAGNLRELALSADFPFISANIKEKGESSPPGFISEKLFLEFNEVRIGITGIISNAAGDRIVNESMEGLEFSPAIEASRLQAGLLREEGADVVVLLSNCSSESNKRIAAENTNIDLIIEGSPDEYAKGALKKEGTVLARIPEAFTHAGHTSLFYSRSGQKPVSYSHRNIPLYIEKFSGHEGLDQLLEEELASVSKEMDRVIGRSERRLSRFLEGEEKKHGELAAGNFQTDVMREVSESDMAFQTVSAIRADIPEGEIKVGDIWAFEPLGSSIVTMELKGEQIKELLELSVAHKYSRLQFSGLEMIYNDSLPEGKRVLNVFVFDEEGEKKELEPQESYKVATSLFLAEGGDGYDIFSEGEDVEDTSILLREALIDYIKENSPVSASLESRMINVRLN
ncbi:MAG: bifunctional metallophosphatase/5'-nucleotidase [Elusimicrobiota bacterium]